MKEEKAARCRILIDSGLLAFLNPESNEKHSKLAAFRNLLDLSTKDKKEFPAIAKPLPQGQVALTVSGLAKHWNWHRNTVRKFLTELELSERTHKYPFVVGGGTALEPLAVWIPHH